jgi:hypothetical protein
MFRYPVSKVFAVFSTADKAILVITELVHKIESLMIVPLLHPSLQTVLEG